MDNREYPSRGGRETLAAQRDNTRADTWCLYRWRMSLYRTRGSPLPVDVIEDYRRGGCAGEVSIVRTE
jgi:hypothetical protein